MSSFTIKDLEHLTGIKAHTIRIWEQRYHLFRPQRTTGNIRHYSLAHLKQALDVSLLIKQGFRISRLAAMTPQDIEQHISSIKEQLHLKLKTINSLILSMLSEDIETFEFILDNAVITWGIDETIQGIIIPFLEKTNLLYYTDCTVKVHFVVTAIRKKIILGIEESKPSGRNNKTALLFLPKGEHYDLILLYLNYLLKLNGTRILYLGTDISVEHIATLAQQKSIDYLITYLTPKKNHQVKELLNYFKAKLPNQTLLITGFWKNHSIEEQPHLKPLFYNDVPMYIH